MSSSARRAPKSVSWSLGTPYMILTPGGNVITKQLVINVPLNLGGKVYEGPEKAIRGGKCEPIKIP
jgi:hypothetical protein